MDGGMTSSKEEEMEDKREEEAGDREFEPHRFEAEE